MKHAILSGIIFLFAFVNILAFAEGSSRAHRDGECIYSSVASYFPAFFAGCELFKIRWPDPEDDPRHMNPEFIK